MRILLKILAAPIVAVLMVTVQLCVGVLYCVGMVMSFACWVFVLIGVYALLAVSVPQGIILLVIAFLLSPLGLPTAAAWLLGKAQTLRYFIQDVIY